MKLFWNCMVDYYQVQEFINYVLNLELIDVWIIWILEMYHAYSVLQFIDVCLFWTNHNGKCIVLWIPRTVTKMFISPQSNHDAKYNNNDVASTHQDVHPK